MSGPWENALHQARQERPSPLPPGFAAAVMDRLHRQSPPAFRTRELLAMAAAVVAIAAAIPLIHRSGPPAKSAPPLALFGEPQARAPFTTP